MREFDRNPIIPVSRALTIGKYVLLCDPVNEGILGSRIPRELVSGRGMHCEGSDTAKPVHDSEEAEQMPASPKTDQHPTSAPNDEWTTCSA